MMRFTASEAKFSNYLCAAIALVILFTRIVVSRYRKRPIDSSFYLVITSIVVDICRIVVVYYVLLYGTASDALSDERYFDIHNMDSVRKGSILSLIARVLITSSCWLQICLLLSFYSCMMSAIPWVRMTIKLTWAMIVGTYVAVVLATFLECRPLHLYWQIDPNPGKCVKAFIQIFLQCMSNIILDILLIVISIPILIPCKNRSWQQHLRIAILFALGTFCIIVTILRIISIWDNNGVQPTRSVWASTAMVVSTFVANAPTIYGDLKVAKRNKSEAGLRRASRPELFGQDVESVFPGSWNLGTGLQTPARIVTNETRGSNASSGSVKEWWDHGEYAR